MFLKMKRRVVDVITRPEGDDVMDKQQLHQVEDNRLDLRAVCLVRAIAENGIDDDGMERSNWVCGWKKEKDEWRAGGDYKTSGWGTELILTRVANQAGTKHARSDLCK